MKKSGFTLAEVLITLGVLGIVIAMTLPALLQSYKQKEYSTKLKKFYSVMQNAINLSESYNGPVGDWVRLGGINDTIVDDEGNTDFEANRIVIEDWFKRYLSSYIQHSSFQTGNSNWKLGQAKIVFNDGTHLYLHNGNCIDFFVDLNGEKGANSHGIDIFHFYLCPNEKCEKQSWNKQCGKLTPYRGAEISRAAALDLCKTSPDTCAYVLLQDNFEFKKDYPYRVK